MANNKTDVPRCEGCGQYMSKAEESRRVVFYECCGITRQRTKPEWKRQTRREAFR